MAISQLKSQPIIKRPGTTFQFSAIKDVTQLSSSFCWERIRINVNFRQCKNLETYQSSFVVILLFFSFLLFSSFSFFFFLSLRIMSFTTVFRLQSLLQQHSTCHKYLGFLPGRCFGSNCFKTSEKVGGQCKIKVAKGWAKKTAIPVHKSATLHLYYLAQH